MITLDKIYQASYALKNIIRRTDLIYAPAILPDCQLYLKPENLQVTGSFKVRGAAFKISQLTPEEKSRGVIACSAGQPRAGRGARRHPQRHQIAHLPADGAPISKVSATKGYGAEVAWWKACTTTPTTRPWNCGTNSATPSCTPSTTRTSLPARAPLAWRSSTTFRKWTR